MENKSESAVFSAMQTEEPYKSYRKTILGQVYVKILNPFNPLETAGVILSGESNTEETAVVHVWSQKEDKFLKTMNRSHFERGFLVEFEGAKKKEVSQEEKYNTLSDDELNKLLSSKYFKLQAEINKMTSEAPLYRLLTLADEQEKSEKIVNLIKGRLSEIQALPEPPQQVE
ncbi:MAG: hypothetical protein ACW99G_07990 [Candidatus Thorarchaeota archaeon]|jgi:hypothetical protein